LRGWDDESFEALEVIDLDLSLPFPGAHSDMLIEPHVGIVAEKLRERLRTARATCLDSAEPRAAAHACASADGL
jgi:thioesterase domain-containing protein